MCKNWLLHATLSPCRLPPFALPVTTTAFISDCLAALKRIFLSLHLALKITHLRASTHKHITTFWIISNISTLPVAKPEFSSLQSSWVDWKLLARLQLCPGCRKGISISLSMSFTIALTATSSPNFYPCRIQHSQSTKPITSEWAAVVYLVLVFSTSAWETNLGLLQIFLSVL